METFEEYIKNFSYESIPAMKISSKRLLELIPENAVQVIDVRFNEEREMWKTGLMTHIPLNELPDRLEELDKEKLIVTVCPHNVRSNIAMHYLMTKGYNVKFLDDGLTTLITLLLGANAQNLYKTMEKGI